MRFIWFFLIPLNMIAGQCAQASTPDFNHAGAHYLRPPTIEQTDYEEGAGEQYPYQGETFSVPHLDQAQAYCAAQGAELISDEQMLALQAATPAESIPLQHNWPAGYAPYLTRTQEMHAGVLLNVVYSLNQETGSLGRELRPSDQAQGYVSCSKVFAVQIEQPHLRTCPVGTVCCAEDNSQFTEANGYGVGDTFQHNGLQYRIVEDGDAAGRGIKNPQLLAKLAQGQEHFCTSRVTDMNFLFQGKAWNDCNHFNQPIDDWDVSQVKTMTAMFRWTDQFNQPLTHWNVSHVMAMNSMFYHSYLFNQAIGNWDVGHVQTMANMFHAAYDFNQPLNNWNIASVISLSDMFGSATAFNQPLDQWDVRQVQKMDQMFRCYWSYGECAFNQDLSAWGHQLGQAAGAVDLQQMFECSKHYQQDLSAWSIDKVGEFSGFSSNSQLPDVFNPFCQGNEEACQQANQGDPCRGEGAQFVKNQIPFSLNTK